MRNPRGIIGFVVFSTLLASTVPAREARAKPRDSQVQQDQSIVDAAKRSRELKKNAAPARVITDDDLDEQRPKRNPRHPDVVALAPPQTESSDVMAGASSSSDESGAKNSESVRAATEDAEIANLKSQLASAETALDLQQRELLLSEHIIYSNPRYTATHIGKAELDSAKLQIEQTQQEIDRLKGPLANLEWRQWRRMQAERSEDGSPVEPVPPSALVLPSR